MAEDIVITSADDGTQVYNIYSYYEFIKSEYSDNAALIKLVERFVKYCESAKAYRALMTNI